MNFHGDDLASKLIAGNLGMEISFTEQRMEVRKINQRTSDIFTNDELPYNIAPTKRDNRSGRNLVPNRPLQMNANNNSYTNNSNVAMISANNKRMIQNFLSTNNTQRSGGNASNASRFSAVSNESRQQIASNNAPNSFLGGDLPVGSMNVVYCPYVSDGPKLFWIQLKSREHILDRMTNDLANISPQTLTTKVTIGLPCLARYAEDQCLYRAVISSIHGNGCQVTFVDYGNSESVPFAHIYEIPKQFLLDKTFAVSFQLAKYYELEPIDEQIKNSFEEIVKNSELDLKVVASESPQLQQCELYYNNVNMLNLLKAKQKELTSFSNAVQLKTNDMVIIRYAYTAQTFFVQKVDDIPAYDAMMDKLFAYCVQSPKLKKLPSIGECCATIIFGNKSNECYRVTVLEHINASTVRVKLVDYGFEKEYHLNDLREITSEFRKLPCQAIQCCLIDFENVAEVSTTTGKQLEMVAEDSNGERAQFRVILRQHLSNSVNLIDLRDEEKKINVALNVYKLAMPRKLYDKKSSNKGKDEMDNKSMKSTSTNGSASKTSFTSVSDQSKGTVISNGRECDGAESQERFVEHRPKELRYPNKNQNDNAERTAKANKSWNENSKWRSNETQSQPQSKAYGNR